MADSRLTRKGGGHTAFLKKGRNRKIKLRRCIKNIVQGFSGALSDRLQKRKGIALAGYFVAAIAKLFMGISTVWQGVFSARLLDGAGDAAVFYYGAIFGLAGSIGLIVLIPNATTPARLIRIIVVLNESANSSGQLRRISPQS